jgi:hypothetical protein
MIRVSAMVGDGFAHVQEFTQVVGPFGVEQPQIEAATPSTKAWPIVA